MTIHRRADETCASLVSALVSQAACRDFALTYSWENSARQFLSHLNRVAKGKPDRPNSFEAVGVTPRLIEDSGSLAPEGAAKEGQTWTI